MYSNMILQLLLVAIWVSVVQSTVISECPPDSKRTPKKANYDVKHINIQGCQKQPCVFYKGEYYEMETLAVIKYSTKSITYIASIVTDLGAIDVGKGDGCKYVTDDVCEDLKPGVEIRAKFRDKVPEIIPAFEGILRVTIMDDNNTPQYCGQLHVILKERRSIFTNPFEGFG